jgi:predicted ATPase
VGQETELAALDSHLQKALAGRLQIVFVCGEAGSGKTSLLKEFLRRSLTAHPKLAAGIGTCNAFFGQGVPYLPFRDILNMLAGDVESLYSNGDISRNQAVLMLESFPLVVQTLTDKCPELIDSFVGSTSIKERVAVILRIMRISGDVWRRRPFMGTLDERKNPNYSISSLSC